MANGAAAAGAAAAYTASAIKASGAIVRVEPRDFLAILARAESAPLIVTSTSSFPLFGTTHRYLTGYKGLVFFTKTGEPLEMPADAEIIAAKKIWIPDL